jgi:RHS repeat-associated protein
VGIQSTGTFANRFLYTGREWLEETCLYDYRNRVYSTTLGRFLQTDPIRFEAGDGNLYRYVFNSVTDSTDALGLEVVCGEPYVKVLDVYTFKIEEDVKGTRDVIDTYLVPLGRRRCLLKMNVVEVYTQWNEVVYRHVRQQVQKDCVDTCNGEKFVSIVKFATDLPREKLGSIPRYSFRTIHEPAGVKCSLPTSKAPTPKPSRPR